jgi:hypothetical protein
MDKHHHVLSARGDELLAYPRSFNFAASGVTEDGFTRLTVCDERRSGDVEAQGQTADL